MDADKLLNLMTQLHENHLELRRNFMALMGSQRALLEQLYEKDIIDPERWQRDKVRFTQEYEQLAAKKDDEQRQEKAEDLKRQMQRAFGPGTTGVMRFHSHQEPNDDSGPEAA